MKTSSSLVFKWRFVCFDSYLNGTGGLLTKPSKLILLISLFDYFHWNGNSRDFKVQRNPVALKVTKWILLILFQCLSSKKFQPEELSSIPEKYACSCRQYQSLYCRLEKAYSSWTEEWQRDIIGPVGLSNLGRNSDQNF